MGLFKVRRTTTPGLIPAGLTYGEMAVNLADRILYVGGTAENAIEIAGGSGNYRFFYQADAPGLSQGYGITGETGQYDYLIGSRWIDSDTGREYVYIGDGDQWYWVEPPGGGGGAEGTWIRPDATTATDVAGIPAGTTGLVGESSIQILERILYPYQNVGFSNLTTNLANEFELGQTGGNSTVNVSWSVTPPLSNWKPNSASYSYSGITSGTLFSSVSPTAGSPQSVTYPVFKTTSLTNNTLNLTINGQQLQGNVAPFTRQSRWWSRMYFGKSSNSNLLVPVFDVATGVNSSDFLRVSPTTNPQGPNNFNVSVGPGDGFFYLFIHSAYTLNNDLPYFGLKFAGLALAQDQVVTVSITNSHGHTATYRRYKSFERLNDQIVVTLNPPST